MLTFFLILLHLLSITFDGFLFLTLEGKYFLEEMGRSILSFKTDFSIVLDFVTLFYLIIVLYKIYKNLIDPSHVEDITFQRQVRNNLILLYLFIISVSILLISLNGFDVVITRIGTSSPENFRKILVNLSEELTKALPGTAPELPITKSVVKRTTVNIPLPTVIGIKQMLLNESINFKLMAKVTKEDLPVINFLLNDEYKKAFYSIFYSILGIFFDPKSISNTELGIYYSIVLSEEKLILVIKIVYFILKVNINLRVADTYCIITNGHKISSIAELEACITEPWVIPLLYAKEVLELLEKFGSSGLDLSMFYNDCFSLKDLKPSEEGFYELLKEYEKIKQKNE